MGAALNIGKGRFDSQGLSSGFIPELCHLNGTQHLFGEALAAQSGERLGGRELRVGSCPGISLGPQPS